MQEARVRRRHECPALRVCPVGTLSQSGLAPVVDESKCTDCGKCVRYCPMGALQKAGQQAPVTGDDDWIRQLYFGG